MWENFEPPVSFGRAGAAGHNKRFFSIVGQAVPDEAQPFGRVRPSLFDNKWMVGCFAAENTSLADRQAQPDLHGVHPIAERYSIILSFLAQLSFSAFFLLVALAPDPSANFLPCSSDHFPGHDIFRECWPLRRKVVPDGLQVGLA